MRIVRVVMYSTGCPRCNILKSKLDSSGVEYEVCDDIEKMKSLGIMSVPVLGVDDELLGFTDAIQKISQLS